MDKPNSLTISCPMAIFETLDIVDYLSSGQKRHKKTKAKSCTVVTAKGTKNIFIEDG